MGAFHSHGDYLLTAPKEMNGFEMIEVKKIKRALPCAEAISLGSPSEKQRLHGIIVAGPSFRKVAFTELHNDFSSPHDGRTRSQ